MGDMSHDTKLRKFQWRTNSSMRLLHRRNVATLCAELTQYNADSITAIPVTPRVRPAGLYVQRH
jgi:hypothetical protein